MTSFFGREFTPFLPKSGKIILVIESLRVASFSSFLQHQHMRPTGRYGFKNPLFG